jgi:hypothetical protein
MEDLEHILVRCSRRSKSFPNGMDIGMYMVQVRGNQTVPSKIFWGGPRPPVTARLLGPKGLGISIILEENEDFVISTLCTKCFKPQLA